MSSEERKERKCFADVRNGVRAKRERGGKEKKGIKLSFLPSISLARG